MFLQLSPNAGATNFPYGIATSQDNGDMNLVTNNSATFGIVPSVAYVPLTTQASGTYEGLVYGQLTLPQTATIRNIRFYVLGAATGGSAVGDSELSIVTAGTAIPGTGNILTDYNVSIFANGSLLDVDMSAVSDYNLLQNVPLGSTLYFVSDGAYAIAAGSNLIMEVEYYFLNVELLNV